MNRLERVRPDPWEILQDVLDSWQSKLWTAIPGQIISFNAELQTAVVQVVLQMPVTDSAGKMSNVSISPLADVLVYFPSGGGFTLTFPVQSGDECLVVFSTRCIDSWWQTAQVSPLADFRKHDLSDGIAFVGIRSKPKVLANVSTTATQLRADDGSALIEVGEGGIKVLVPNGSVLVQASTATITASAGATINANTQINGNLLVSGDITDNNGANSRTLAGMRAVYNGHDHTDPQGGTTGGPSGSM